MSDTLNVEIDEKAVLRALKKAPIEVGGAVSLGIRRAAIESANKMKKGVAKATSTLVNSIGVDQVNTFEFRAGPHVAYARYVEQGRQPGKLPNIGHVADWVKNKAGVLQGRDVREVSWAIAKGIQRNGIKAQPFVKPVVESGFAARRLNKHVRAGVASGLKRAGL